MLFPSYELLRLIMEPRDVGHQGVHRKRAFLFLRHKKRCEYLMDLYNVFNMTSRGVQRAVSTEPRDYLVSSNAVQQVQNSHMARKRKITHQPDPCQCNKLILFCVWCSLYTTILIYENDLNEYTLFKKTMTIEIWDCLEYILTCW